MDQTQTGNVGSPDRGRYSDLDPDGNQTRPPDQTQTANQTQTNQTQTQTDQTRPPGLLRLGNQTQTNQTGQTQTGREAMKINRPAGLGGDQTQTDQTQTGHSRRPVTIAKNAARSFLGRAGYLYALTAVVATVAAIGQKVFAEEKAHFTNQIKIWNWDVTPWLSPFVFDFAVAALLHGGLNAARRRNSPWPWWAAATGIAGISVWTNMQHEGAMITAPASAGLFLIWGLHLLDEYKVIIRRRELLDAVAEDFLRTDVLFGFDGRLAEKALQLSRKYNMHAALAYRRGFGEDQFSRRDVAIRAAEIYLEIFDDQLFVLMNPAAAAPAGRTEDDEQSKTKPGTPVRFWQSRRRERAEQLADMTATDAVKEYLGIPLPDRQGVRLARYSYVAPEPAPALPPAPMAAALPQAVEQPALPQAARPVRRRVAAAEPARREPVVIQLADDEPDGMPVVLQGTAGRNWLSLDQITGLPQIDEREKCPCGTADKPCKWLTFDHVERRGQQIQTIMTAVKTWATREENFGKEEVKVLLKITGVDTVLQVMRLMNHLRSLSRAQAAREQEGADAA